MTYDRPPVYLSASPEYVLAVIRDSYRQQCQYDSEAEPDVDLTFETTIDEWGSTCDLLETRALGRALDAGWELGRSDAEWLDVLEPAGVRTLRGLCEFVAEGRVRPVVEPVTILGSTSLAAGAFLTIRSLLRESGADVGPVRPSTPLGEYARHHLGVFLGPISSMAPGVLPEVKIRTPWYDLSLIGIGIGWLLLAAGLWLSPSGAVAGGLILFASWAANWAISNYVASSEVVFGDLRTFRDLAKVVADGAERSSSLV